MNPITVVGRATAKPGRRDELERLLRAVIVPTHAEDECLHYSIHQSTTDPDTFVAVERWPGQESLERHLGTPHLKQLADVIGEVLVSPLDIQTFVQLHEGDSAKGVL
ncbi:putative quinol monooxygenase [Streptomyces sp. NPDC051976]|uniref:putative quinol monooxygenase n=1 Tax=Streptomyces sp. NPDC051976 TaxID=3154947 RepID=UPI003417FABA